MALSNEERILLAEHFDIYDLIEALGLTANDIINTFDNEIEDNPELMERIGGA